MRGSADASIQGEEMGEVMVVGIDGSQTAQRAVSEAVRLAKGLGAELRIVGAHQRIPRGLVAGAPDAGPLLMEAVPDSAAESR